MKKTIVFYLIILASSGIYVWAQSSRKNTKAKAVVTGIRQIDFKNYAYPRSDGRIKVRNGKWKGEYPGEYFSVERIVYGDLNGDGKEEAVVTISESGGGSGQFSGGIIFTLQNGRVETLLVKDRSGYGPYDGIPGGDRGNGGIYNISIQNGRIVVEQYAPGKGANDPPYQAKYIVTTQYKWNGKFFVPEGGIQRRAFTK